MIVIRTDNTAVSLLLGEGEKIVAGSQKVKNILVDLDKSWWKYTQNMRIMFQHEASDKKYSSPLTLINGDGEKYKYYSCQVPEKVTKKPGEITLSIVAELNTEVMVSQNIRLSVCDSVLSTKGDIESGYPLTEWGFFS